MLGKTSATPSYQHVFIWKQKEVLGKRLELITALRLAFFLRALSAMMAGRLAPLLGLWETNFPSVFPDGFGPVQSLESA
jgi:hypothetical protein